MHAEHPELVKDQFWDEGIPDELPYTVTKTNKQQRRPRRTTACFSVSQTQQIKVIPLISSKGFCFS